MDLPLSSLENMLTACETNSEMFQWLGSFAEWASKQTDNESRLEIQHWLAQKSLEAATTLRKLEPLDYQDFVTVEHKLHPYYHQVSCLERYDSFSSFIFPVLKTLEDVTTDQISSGALILA